MLAREVYRATNAALDNLTSWSDPTENRQITASTKQVLLWWWSTFGNCHVCQVGTKPF